ncbi:bifunctional lysylphosphatidylglycerol flippase/synthetase MprF [Frondihabitans australicus]|uniref:Lysylphosphatidylglycerol synthetase-like protein (DUF2156 family) n=1 Tax=Frondihabitans australicus TaxID=386892 RepID=A0A495IE28_9MICO|nr:DUF2156 domain-containing protein [Frondihabitans australicus]RKR73910.1 lysylphosphatidylglycerol synthetase-like protein (DUF2156 family) [Frondihabitans australicus]
MTDLTLAPHPTPSRALTWLRDLARQQPVSLVIAAVLVVLALVSGSALHGPSDALRDVIGAGVAERTSANSWIATLASVLFSGSLPELIATVIAVLVLVGAAERRIGHGRALAAYLITGVVATVIGVAVQAIGIGIGEVWALEVAYDTTLHPFTPALGTIMTASAFAGPLWRRRIRIIGFASITTFLLYDGHPSGLYALLGAVAGLALGRFLRPRGRVVARLWTRSSHHEARVLLSTLVFITALGPLVTIVTRAPIGILAPLGSLFGDSLPPRHLTRPCTIDATCIRDVALGDLHGPGTLALSLLPLVTLIVAALLIRRARRIAVWAAILVNLLLALLAALYYGVLPLTSDVAADMPGHHVERFFLGILSAVAPLIVAVVLFVFLHHFTVRTPRHIVRQYIALLVASFVLLAGFYISVGFLGRERFSPPITLGRLVFSAPERFIPVGFVGLDRVGPVPTDGPLRGVFVGVGPLMWLIVVVGLVVAAGVTGRAGGASRRGAVARILRRGVSGHLGQMALWSGTSYWLSDDGAAAVAYREVGGTAITVGDPLCDQARAAQTVLEFARWCDDQGLVPVFYSVRETLAPAFAEMGWPTLPVAEETVLHPASFSLQGKKWQDVRTSMNRATRSGVRAVWTRYVDLRPSVARQIEDISEQWVADKELPEMGFTLGGLDELMDRDVRLMLAVDEREQVLAVTSWLPTWRDGEVVGWTLDFMRRRADSIHGVMEFLIASAALRAQEDGIEFVSLSAAPLAGVDLDGDDPDRSQAERVMAFLARALEPAYGFRSLLTFKAKFQPEFSTLLMAYPDPLQLPAIGTALARAYVPELRVSRLPRLLRSVV